MKRLLMTPGPFQVPDEVLRAMSEPLIHHRTSEFRKLFGEVLEGLRYVFRTEDDVMVLTASGTAGMESAVLHSLLPAQRALVVRGGKFGERWREICSAYGIPFDAIDVEWGTAVEPKEVERRLTEETGAVFVQLCETSTGTLNDVKRIGEILRGKDVLLVVDGISAVGAVPCETSQWGIDILVVGSQKALMVPPGLAFVSLSERAWERAQKAERRGYYLDLLKARKSLQRGDTPYTPAISLVVALHRALEMIKAEGIENVWERHSRLAEATRSALRAIGLELFSKSPSDSVTAFCAPDGIDAEEIRKRLREQFRIYIAGGQEHLKGKICRIGHMGYVSAGDILMTLSAVECVLSGLGYRFERGSGVGKAEEVICGESADS